MDGVHWTSSDSEGSDGWEPAVAKKKQLTKRPVISDDTDDSDSEEIIGCTSDEEEEEEGKDSESCSTAIVEGSFEEEYADASEELEEEDGKEGSSTSLKGFNTSENNNVRKANSCNGSPTTAKPGKDVGNGTAQRSSSSKSGDSTEEVSPENIEDSKTPTSSTRTEEHRLLFKDSHHIKERKINKLQVTSTPVVTGFKKPACLDITAIPGNLPRFNATLLGSDESPEEVPRRPITSLKAHPVNTKSASSNSGTQSKKVAKPIEKDVEDMLVAGLNDITLKGQQQFTFKKKTNDVGMARTVAVGATCVDYYSDDDEADDSISANFDFDDAPVPDSGKRQSREQDLSSGSKSKPTVWTVDDSDDEITCLSERMQQLPLGPPKPVKQDVPKKAIFLNEPPPVEKKTYSYNPADVKHQEFYGDVQRTVSKMAKTIEDMPMPDDKDDQFESPKGLIQLFDHQVYGLRWLSWREREFPGGGILADEMGLGKTIMIIGLIMKSKAEAPQGDSENWIDMNEVGSCIPSKTTLVICPVGCILQWNDEINSKGKGLRAYLFHGQHRTTSAAQLAQYDVVLTTYHTVIAEVPKDGSDSKHHKSPLKRLYWKRIVLDEAHNIRNPKTASALSICQLKARHRWAVTGTPVHNRPEDFYSVVKFLKLTPFDDPKVWDFWIGMKQVRKASDANQRLQTLGKALILRRTKDEVQAIGGNVEKIPPKKIEIVEVELSEAERRVYDYLMQFCKNMFKQFLEDKEQRTRQLNAAAMTYTAERRKKKAPSGEDGTPQDIGFSHLFALLIRLRQCAVLPHLIHTMLEDEEIDEDVSFDELNDEHIVSKMNPVFDRLYESSKIQKILADLTELREQAIAENRPMDKVVIVSSWTYTLEILHDHLRRMRLSCVFITGKEKTQDRSDNMKKFNKYPEKYHICLLSLMAGGVGINLVGGNHVFFVEPHWNPQMELQAQDRVHRFGQKKDVIVKRYISKETVESRIMDIQEQKLTLADGVLNSAKRTRGGGLSIDQLRRLFE